jgi:hypothetical protein
LLDHAICSRIHKRLVTVVEPHQVWRCAVRTPHLNDLAAAVWAFDRLAADEDPLAC